MDLRLSTIWLPNIQDVETLTLTAEGDMVYAFSATKVLNEERSTETVPAYDLEIVNAGERTSTTTCTRTSTRSSSAPRCCPWTPPSMMNRPP